MSRDYKDLLSQFNARGVEYLVIGAYALAAHGHVRATGDLDLWVRPDPANATKVMESLQAFGAPLQDLSKADLSGPGLVVQIGAAPLRIDILTSIEAVSFDEAWAGRTSAKLVDLSLPVLSARHIIRNKRAVGRAQDLADVEWLEKSGKK